jgi:hypothetical protein
MQIEIPALHLTPYPDFDETAGPTWIVPHTAVPQATLIQVDDRGAAHTIT